MPSIGAADAGANAEAALYEVEPVAGGTADAVEFHPAHVRLIDSTLIDQVLHKPSHGIVRERGDDRGLEPEAALQPAGNVVFAAAFPHAERSRRVHARFAGIETQHDLAERDQVPAASGFFRNRQRHRYHRPIQPPSTASTRP